MTAPEPYEARLGSATDQEWLEAHEALCSLLAETDFPQKELTFIWDPELDPKTLIGPHEADHGPAIEEAPDGSA